MSFKQNCVIGALIVALGLVSGSGCAPKPPPSQQLTEQQLLDRSVENYMSKTREQAIEGECVDFIPRPDGEYEISPDECGAAYKLNGKWVQSSYRFLGYWATWYGEDGEIVRTERYFMSKQPENFDPVSQSISPDQIFIRHGDEEIEYVYDANRACYVQTQ